MSAADRSHSVGLSAGVGRGAERAVSTRPCEPETGSAALLVAPPCAAGGATDGAAARSEAQRGRVDAGLLDADTPLTNRGYERTAFPPGRACLGDGWLRGTVRAPVDAVAQLLEQFLGPVLELDHGTKHYARSASVGALGALIAWEPKGAPEVRALEILIDIPQQACDALGWQDCVGLYVAVRGLFGFKATRTDVYLDDQRRIVEPRTVFKAWLAGHVVTRFDRKSVSWNEDGSGGACLYMGSRKWGQIFIRVYDKDAEQGAERGTFGVRWEIQARDEKAQALIDQVLLADDPQAAFSAVLRKLVDFRRRVDQGAPHGERAPVLSWWKRLVGSVEAAALVVPSRPETGRALRKVQWLVRVCLPSLAWALAWSGGDPDWFDQVLPDAVPRVKSRDWLLIPRECWPPGVDVSSDRLVA